MEIKGFKFIKTVKGKQILIGAFSLGLILMIVPWGALNAGNGKGETNEANSAAYAQPVFDLREEEKRLEAALSKIEGAGSVTVVLTLETGLERRLAENRDESRDEDADGSVRLRQSSETVTLSDEAVTSIYIYPKYRGALVVASGNGPGVKLQIIQAVAALTGLSSDKITVVKGR